MRRRHHYATTGTRAHLDARVRFDRPASLYGDDPKMGGRITARVAEAIMGDILQSEDDTVTLDIEIAAGAPIERIEIRNRKKVLETWRPYTPEQLGRRIRVIWEGSELRGRGRQTIWDGSATFEGNAIESFTALNQWNLDKPLKQPSANTLEWQTLTTGGFGGVDILLGSADDGRLKIDTQLTKCDLKLSDIGLEDVVLETGGGIDRRMRIFRLPDVNPVTNTKLTRRIKRNESEEDALYVCITLEDGHLIWSSPIYLLR